MLRSSLLFLSRADRARSLITHWSVARGAASRFVAGETLDEALAVIRALNARGLKATLDHLGESVTNEAEARRAAEAYVAALDRVAESHLCSNVSLKLTQLGLDLSQDLCERNVRRILEKARATDNFVRIDMEGTPHTDRTLAVFRALHREFDNVGIVVQSYLYRTERDVLALTDEAAPARVRLCKGAYDEPPELAYPRKADVDANFVRLSRLLLDRARRLPPADGAGCTPPLLAIATHDEQMIAAARTYAEQTGIPRPYYEFQMLYGIRRDLQDRLAAEGYAVRVYVPYGTSWYPYFMRRLAERPANVWFFLSNLIRR